MKTNLKINEHQYDLSAPFIEYYKNVEYKYYFDYNGFKFLPANEFLNLKIPEFKECQFIKFNKKINESILELLKYNNHNFIHHILDLYFKKVLEFFNEIDGTGKSIEKDTYMVLMKTYYDSNKSQVIIQYYENKKITCQ
ncbi:MAG: hypothetical protein U9Q27_02005 [Patescibacteria group bacterium]|nr:hypothetical protein [Patescibacteria group bacterium]